MPPLLRRQVPIIIPTSDFGQSSEGDDGESGGGILAVALSTPACVLAAQAGTLDTRQRGGTATLCGENAFQLVSPGPQPRYRRLTQSGSLTFCHYAAPVGTGCQASDGDSSFGIIYSGSCVYDATTCAFSDGTASTIFRSGSPACVINGGDTPTANCGLTGADCALSSIVSSTVVTRSGNGVCCTFTGGSRKASGSATMTLSEEDTDADAIARLLAGSAWSAWSPCASPATCALAQWEQRAAVADYDFAYQECEYRVQGTGLPPLRAICVQVDVYRRLYGAGPYVLYATQQSTGNTDVAGNITVSGVVPNEQGYQTYVSNPQLFPRL